MNRLFVFKIPFCISSTFQLSLSLLFYGNSANHHPWKTDEEGVLHFESGRHPLTETEFTKIYKDFYSGDLDSHSWNKEVSERIASYAFDAPSLLLTIDGIPTQPRSTYPLFTPVEDAIYDWVRLPARPNMLNHTGKLYLVRGDNDSGYWKTSDRMI